MSSHDGVTTWGCRYSGGLYFKYVVTEVKSRSFLEEWRHNSAGYASFTFSNTSTGTFYHSMDVNGSDYVGAGVSYTKLDTDNARKLVSNIVKCL